jgi:hypothetical protein
MKKLFYSVLAVIFFCLSVYLVSVDNIEMPSRYGSLHSTLSAPVLYMLAILPLSFSVSITLYLIYGEKYAAHSKVIVGIGIVIFFVGMVIVSPILKAIE